MSTDELRDRGSIFYNFNRVCSYDAIITFVVGGRSIGKTYGMTKRVIKRAIKQGEQFMWVRRHKEEMQIARRTFFDAVKDEFPNYTFRVNGTMAEAAKGIPADFEAMPAGKQKEVLKNIKWFVIGHFVALSGAQKIKGSNFPLVRTIVFDEFILESGLTQYLPSEVKMFNNLYMTIDRKRDTTKVFFLANSVMIDNPYFVHYDIIPDDAVKGIIVKNNGALVVHFPEMADFKNEMFQTRFGQFLLETDPEYADYAINNQFRDNHKMMLGDKDRAADYLYTIETNKGTFSVWSKMFSRTVYVQAKRPRNGERIFTVVAERMGDGKIYLERSNEVLAGLRTYWRHGNMLFDSAQTRNAMLDIFR